MSTGSEVPCVLLVDDHDEIRALVGQLLEKEGYRVAKAANAQEAYAVLGQQRVDLILLDVMLPKVDGFALCRDLRAEYKGLPIIMLTAKSDEIDRVLGLELGADDYVTKPFSGRELLARIKAVFRRAPGSSGPLPMESLDSTVYRFDRWALDAGTRELTLDDDIVVPLSTAEFNVLLVFVTHPGRALSRDQILDLAKGRQATSLDRSIDQQVSRLRRKLGDNARNPKLIKTVWGGGYVFAAKVSVE